MRQRLMVLGAMAAGLSLPASAGAAGPGMLDTIPLPAAANSITRAADGAIWATIPSRNSVVRVAPDGTTTESADLGGTTAGIAYGAGRIWVAVTPAKKVVAIDPANAASILSTTPTPPGSCGPVAVAVSTDTAYVSLPDTSGLCTPALMSVSSAGVASPAVTGRGNAFDLAVTSGKLFVPDQGGDAVRRLGLGAGLPVESTYTTPVGASPSGVGVAADGKVVVSLFGSGAIADVAPAQSGGSVTERATGVTSAFGVTAGIGNTLWAAGSAGVIRRITLDGSPAPVITPPAGSEPWDVVADADGTAWFTDLGNARLIRIVSRPPRVTTGSLGPLPAILFDQTSATAELTMNPGGNATSYGVEFGPTTSYGRTAIAGAGYGVADLTLTATLDILTPGTTYHYRAFAFSPEGTAYGEDRTFTTVKSETRTPATSAPKITLTRSTRSGLRVSKIRLSGLGGGEKIAVTCTGAGCPSKKKDRTYGTSAKKAGSLTVKASKITAAKLRKGAKVTVIVSKKGATTVTATATATSTKKLSVKTRCRAVGAKTSTAC